MNPTARHSTIAGAESPINCVEHYVDPDSQHPSKSLKTRFPSADQSNQ